MGVLTLQEIFCLGYPAYERTHALPSHVRHAARAIMSRSREVRGGMHYQWKA